MGSSIPPNLFKPISSEGPVSTDIPNELLKGSKGTSEGNRPLKRLPPEELFKDQTPKIEVKNPKQEQIPTTTPTSVPDIATPSTTMSTPHETPAKDFVSLLESVLKEVVEPLKAALTSAYQSSQTQVRVANYDPKEVQLLREFVKQVQSMVVDHGMSVAQALNTIKVEQGGAFWQNIKEILTQGTLSEASLNGTSPKVATDGKAEPFVKLNTFETNAFGIKAGASSAQSGVESGVSAVAGQVMLELLKLETNPKISLDHLLGNLQILNQNGMKESSQQVLSYLRKKGVLSEESFSHFYALWGSLPERDRQVRKPIKTSSLASLWPILIGLLISGVLIGVKIETPFALATGFAVALLVWGVSVVTRK